MKGNFTNHPSNSGQFKKGQSPKNKGTKRPTMPLKDRFWKLVSGKDTDGCWEWDGAKDKKGYGRFMIWPRTRLAHHVSFELAFGLSPSLPLCVLHRCDNPSCVRPAHLFLGTKSDNNADMHEKDRHAKGTDQPHAVLTDALVRELRERSGQGYTYRAIAEMYGFNKHTIYCAIVGITWRHVQ